MKANAKAIAEAFMASDANHLLHPQEEIQYLAHLNQQYALGTHYGRGGREKSHYYHNNVMKRQEQRHKQKLKERGWGKYYRASLLHSDRDHRGIRREVAPYSVSSVHNSATELMQREAREKLLIQRKNEQRIMRRQADRTEKTLNQMQQAFETETGTSAPSSYDQLRLNQRTYVPKGRAGTQNTSDRKAWDLKDQRVQQEEQARKRFQRFQRRQTKVHVQVAPVHGTKQQVKRRR